MLFSSLKFFGLFLRFVMTPSSKVIVAFAVVTLIQAVSGCRSTPEPPADKPAVQQAKQKCFPIPSDGFCASSLNYSCTTASGRNNLDNMNMTIKMKLRHIADRLLDGNCNCSTRSTELFCRTLLPKCTVAGQYCAANTTESPSILRPNLDYCYEFVNNCLANSPANMLQVLFDLYGNQTLLDLCRILLPITANESWKDPNQFKHCTGQTVTEIQTFFSTTTPSQKPNTNSAVSRKANKQNSSAAIIVSSVCGGIIAILAVIAVVLRCRKRSKHSQNTTTTTTNENEPASIVEEVKENESFYNVLYRPEAKSSPNAEVDYEHLKTGGPTGDDVTAVEYVCARDVSGEVGRYEVGGDTYTEVMKQ